MMTRKDVDNRFQIELNNIDTLVTKNHLVRKIDKDRKKHDKKP